MPCGVLAVEQSLSPLDRPDQVDVGRGQFHVERAEVVPQVGPAVRFDDDGEPRFEQPGQRDLCRAGVASPGDRPDFGAVEHSPACQRRPRHEVDVVFLGVGDQRGALALVGWHHCMDLYLVGDYLQGGTREDGLRVGAVSGAIAFVPAVVGGVLVFGFFLTFLVGGSVMGPRAGVVGAGLFGGLGLLGLFVVGLFGLVYFVGLGAAGGWIGNYVKYDTDIDL